MRAIISLGAALLLAIGAAGCSSDTTTSASTTTSVTDTFSSALAFRGSATRTFKMGTAGTVSIALTALGNGTQRVGLGVGITATSAPCSLAQTVITAASSTPQIVTTADAGTYCVQLYDTGTLTDDTAFTVTVQHPAP